MPPADQRARNLREASLYAGRQKLFMKRMIRQVPGVDYGITGAKSTIDSLRNNTDSLENLTALCIDQGQICMTTSTPRFTEQCRLRQYIIVL